MTRSPTLGTRPRSQVSFADHGPDCFERTTGGSAAAATDAHSANASAKNGRVKRIGGSLKWWWARVPVQKPESPALSSVSIPVVADDLAAVDRHGGEERIRRDRLAQEPHRPVREDRDRAAVVE